MKNTIHIDFETKSFVDLKNHGAWVYSEDESTDIICLAYKYNNEPTRIWEPGQPIPREFTEDVQIIARYVLFEYAIYNNIMVTKYGFPKKSDYKIWICTRALSLVSGMPGSLDPCTKALNVKNKKLEVGNYLINKYSKPAKRKDKSLYFRELSGEDYEKMLLYNRVDVDGDNECYQILKNLYNVALERDVFLLDLEQNVEGLPIDIESLEIIISALDEETKRLENEMGAYRVNVRSVKQMKEAFEKENIAVDNFQGQTVQQILQRQIPPKLKRLLEIRQTLGKASTKKFKALKNRIAKDGTLKYFLHYYGAHTGRYSGMGFQPHNLTRSNTNTEEIEQNIKKIKNREVKELDLVNACKSVLPGMVKAEKGKIFLIGDFAAIEARGCAYLAGELSLLNQFKTGQDVYKVMAGRIFNKRAEDIIKEERYLGKQVILGCTYGMGFNTFLETCKKYNMNVTDQLAEYSVRTYRNTYKKIPELWYTLQDTFKSLILGHMQQRQIGMLTLERTNGFITVQLPSGRKLYYHNVSYNGMKDEMRYFNYQQNKHVYLWGGILTENITQAMCRDILTDRMLLCRNAGLNPILHIHDEIVCYIYENEAEQGKKAFSAIMNTTPEWLPNFPLLTETEISKRYHK